MLNRSLVKGPNFNETPNEYRERLLSRDEPEYIVGNPRGDRSGWAAMIEHVRFERRCLDRIAALPEDTFLDVVSLLVRVKHGNGTRLHVEQLIELNEFVHRRPSTVAEFEAFAEILG